ncbi:hypothetical protein Nepgr_019665 [Nepenthes gracilis]|uniref:Uncharacterized protein n=1 Tax=Nepenthes gracilis TaxID=150966 RepID=A0AAD3SW94_NEPGR|nr:hypothetical protein Nepgr_019665 [Nepenthes gracilis]
MRAGGTFGTTAAEAAAPSLPQPQTQHPVRHSPVPYLFGGLAAMLGLIAFALLILACSYWKLSGYGDNIDGDRDAEIAAAVAPKAQDGLKPPLAPFERNILVIMAGEEKPTFLAIPASSCRASSFGESSSNSSFNDQKRERAVELSEKSRREDGGSSDDQVENRHWESDEPSDHSL